MSDGTDIAKRLGRYGVWRGKVAESLVYGSRNAQDAILQFLVDDGVAGRPNRGKMLDPTFTVVGVHCGPHKAFGNATSVIYAQEFLEGAAALRADTQIASTKVTESAAKDAYVADLGPFPAPGASIVIVKKGPFVVMRTKREGELSEQRWRLPFATAASAITAKNAEGRLVLNITKQIVTDEAKRAGVPVVEARKLAAAPGAAPESRPQVKLGPNTSERITATVEATAVEATVHIKLVQEEAARTNVVFDFEFREVSAEATGTVTRAVKSGQTIKLPFVVTRENITTELTDAHVRIFVSAPTAIPFDPDAREEPLTLVS